MNPNERATVSDTNETPTPDVSGRDRVFKNVLFSWGGYLVVLVAGFILPRAIDKNVGQMQLGIWDFAWSMVHYLQFTSLGIGASVNRYVAKYRAGSDTESLNSAVSSVFALQLVAAAISACLAIVAYMLVPVLMSDLGDTDVKVGQNIVLLLGLSISLAIAFNVFTGVLTGLHRWDVHNIISSMSHLVITVAMVLVLRAGGTLVEVSGAYLLGTAVTQCVLVFAAFRICDGLNIAPRFVSYAMMRKMLVFGGAALLASLPTLLAVQSMSIYIATTLGPAALTILARPLALARHVLSLVNKLAFISTPIASSLQRQGDTIGLRDLAVQNCRWATAIAFPLLATIGILGDKVVEIWMGSAYVSFPVALALAVGFFLPASQSPSYRILMGLNQHGRVAVLGTIASMIVFLIGLLLLGTIGLSLTGAAIVVGATLSVAHGAVVIRQICISIEMPIRKYIQRSMGPTILNGLLFSAWLLGCRYYLPVIDLSSLLIIVAIGCIGFLIIQITFIDDLLLGRLFQKSAGPRLLDGADVETDSRFISNPNTQYRNHLRLIVIRLCKIAGLTHLFARLNRHKIRIVRFHGIHDPGIENKWRPLRTQLSVTDFERYMRHIGKSHRFITLSEAGAIIRGEKPCRCNSVVVTFDDGYENNFTIAGPILKRLKIPASVFVVTEHVRTKLPFFWDRLDFNLQNLAEDQRYILVNGRTFALNRNTRRGKRALYKKIGFWLRTSTHDDQEKVRIVEALNNELEEGSGRSLLDLEGSDQFSRIVSVEGLICAERNGLSIGSHTEDHISLASVSPEFAWRQLHDSKKRLESWLSVSCDTVAYPDGSVSQMAVDAARSAGYSIGVTTQSGLNGVGDDTLQLRRTHLGPDLTDAEIDFQLSGLALLFGRKFES